MNKEEDKAAKTKLQTDEEKKTAPPPTYEQLEAYKRADRLGYAAHCPHSQSHGSPPCPSAVARTYHIEGGGQPVAP